MPHIPGLNGGIPLGFSATKILYYCIPLKIHWTNPCLRYNVRNMKKASILGWLACITGSLAIIAVFFELAALSGAGIMPATVPSMAISGTTSLGALLVGVPMGGCAYHFGRKGLGIVGIVLCVLPFMMRFLLLDLIKW